MGLVLLAVIWLITFISTYFFIAKTWWLPVGASAASAGIDQHFTTTFILMGIVFVAAQVALGYLVWSFRDRGTAAKVSYSHGNTTLEIVWTVLTTILFVGLNLTSSSIWASERFRPAAADSVRVEVTGMQFAWYFRYPGLTENLARRILSWRMLRRAVRRLSAWIRRIRLPKMMW